MAHQASGVGKDEYMIVHEPLYPPTVGVTQSLKIPERPLLEIKAP
jgi:hypothetical protein